MFFRLRLLKRPTIAAVDIGALVNKTGAPAEDLAVLAEAGLSAEQIIQLLQDPLSVVSWATTIETSDNVVVVDELEEGALRLAAIGEKSCGWAITRHDGSAWAIRCARLNLRTDWCWDGHAVLSQAVQHSVSTTAYGNAGGWRVEPSKDGSSGWISQPDRYRTEVKADWKLVVPPSGHQVQSGTAFARHLVNGRGRVVKHGGGWP